MPPPENMRDEFAQTRKKRRKQQNDVILYVRHQRKPFHQNTSTLRFSTGKKQPCFLASCDESIM
jgi:hypothetical protein